MKLDARVDPLEVTQKYEVIYEGSKVPYAVAASEEEGWVEFHVKADDLFVREQDSEGKWQLKLFRKQGRVELRLKSDTGDTH